MTDNTGMRRFAADQSSPEMVCRRSIRVQNERASYVIQCGVYHDNSTARVRCGGALPTQRFSPRCLSAAASICLARFMASVNNFGSQR